MKQIETEVSTRFNHHLSNSAVRTAINLSGILGKGSVRISAVVPRQNTLGSRETGGQDGSGEPADGKSLLAARVRFNAVAQWHSRWEYPWMKHGETAGIAGNENMKGAWIVHVSPYQGCLPSDFGHMTHEAKTHCQIIITSHRPTNEHR